MHIFGLLDYFGYICNICWTMVPLKEVENLPILKYRASQMANVTRQYDCLELESHLGQFHACLTLYHIMMTFNDPGKEAF